MKSIILIIFLLKIVPQELPKPHLAIITPQEIKTDNLILRNNQLNRELSLSNQEFMMLKYKLDSITRKRR